MIATNTMTASTCTNHPKCNHQTGWYGYVYLFFGMFKRYYYVCSLCGKFIPQKRTELS